MLIHNADITGSLTINGIPFNSGSFSGSFRGDGSQLTGITGATTASYVEYSNVGNKPTLVSGSSQITYSGLSGIPSGIVSGSSQVSFNGIVDKPTLVSGSSQVSFNGITDKPTLVSGSAQISYPNLSNIPNGIVSSSTQITGYNIFATTGSNTFNGTQTITGSIFGTGSLTINGCITATGQIVAQTINVQQVTSSIVYSCGSNIFGTNISNTQQFTGSVFMTGSLCVAGAGTFSSNIAATNGTFINGSNQNTLGSGALSLLNYSSYNSSANQNVTLGLGLNDAVDNNIAYQYNLGVGGNASGQNLSLTSKRNNTTDLTILGINGTTGNVGIGTACPSERLDVVGGGLASGNGTIKTGITYSSFGLVGTFSNHNLGIISNSTQRILITSTGIACFACQVCAPVAIFSGCVGINTTAPDSLLHVLNCSNTPYDDANTLASGQWFRVSNPSSCTGATTGMLFVAQGPSGGNGLATINAVTTSCGSMAITFATRNVSGNVTERMRITAAGNVGIGTCNPQKSLELRTGGTSTTPSQIFFGGYSQAIIGGEVGIAFSSNISPSLGSATSTELARAGIGFTYVSAAQPSEFSIGIQCTNVCNSNVRIFNGEERMRITSTGIACFATTVCTPLLTVNAAVRLYGSAGGIGCAFIVTATGTNEQPAILIEKAGGFGQSEIRSYYNNVPNYGIAFRAGETTGMYIQSQGNVGINTSSPLEKLSVTGNLHVAGVGNNIYFDTDGSGRAISQFVANLYEFHILNARGNSSRFILGNNSISLGTSGTQYFTINTSAGVSCFSNTVCAPRFVGPLTGAVSGNLNGYPILAQTSCLLGGSSSDVTVYFTSNIAITYGINDYTVSSYLDGNSAVFSSLRALIPYNYYASTASTVNLASYIDGIHSHSVLAVAVCKLGSSNTNCIAVRFARSSGDVSGYRIVVTSNGMYQG